MWHGIQSQLHLDQILRNSKEYIHCIFYNSFEKNPYVVNICVLWRPFWNNLRRWWSKWIAGSLVRYICVMKGKLWTFNTTTWLQKVSIIAILKKSDKKSNFGGHFEKYLYFMMWWCSTCFVNHLFIDLAINYSNLLVLSLLKCQLTAII